MTVLYCFVILKRLVEAWMKQEDINDICVRLERLKTVVSQIQVQIQVLNVHLSLPKVNATNLRLLSNLIPLIKSPLISFPSMKLNPQLTFHFDLSMDFHSNYLQVDFQ